MRILHVAPVPAGKVSGLSKSIPTLAHWQAKLGASVLLINSASSLAASHGPVPTLEWKDRPADLRAFDILVFHSTFIPRHVALGSLARKQDIPYILVPRGGLTRGALHVKALKKWLARRLVFDRFFRGASAISFLSESEANQSEQFGLPYIISGNGCELPPSAPRNPKQPGSYRLLFLGRLEPYVKGLDLLLRAIASRAPEVRAACCNIALVGPSTPHAYRKLSRLLRRLGLTDLVTILGPIARDAISSHLNQTDLLLQTSRFEGMPNSVLEAMAHAVPVLLTPGTNLGTEITKFEAGWLAQPTIHSIAATLLDALKSRSELLRRGANARNLVSQHFTWERVARASLTGYASVLERRFARGEK